MKWEQKEILILVSAQPVLTNFSHGTLDILLRASSTLSG